MPEFPKRRSLALPVKCNEHRAQVQGPHGISRFWMGYIYIYIFLSILFSLVCPAPSFFVCVFFAPVPQILPLASIVPLACVSYCSPLSLCAHAPACLPRRAQPLPEAALLLFLRYPLCSSPHTHRKSHSHTHRKSHSHSHRKSHSHTHVKWK